MIWAAALYAAWTAATWVFEGRIELLRRPDPAARLEYALVVNVALGTLAAAWAIRRGGIVVLTRSARRTAASVAVAVAAAAGLAMLQAPTLPTVGAVALLNVFAMVPPTSIAETMVCWAAVGGAVRSRWGVAAAIVAADVLFGLYHFAHSAPFHEPRWVFLLMLPGLVTSLVYFLNREIWSALAAQNFLATFGVAKAIQPLTEPNWMSYGVAVISVAALAAAVWWGRQGKRPTD
jgi:hypothetical protein